MFALTTMDGGFVAICVVAIAGYFLTSVLPKALGQVFAYAGIPIWLVFAIACNQSGYQATGELLLLTCAAGGWICGPILFWKIMGWERRK